MLQEIPLRSGSMGVSSEDRYLYSTTRPLLFVSDLHLSHAIPHTTAAFEHFIHITADDVDSVFILGDLFEYWVGDDMLTDPFVQRIVELMHTLSERSITLYIMHGNRDFLLGKYFMKAAGAIWVPDPTTITMFGLRITLSHGDILCTADHGSQLFRRCARNRLLQICFLAWPLNWRRVFAKRMRKSSEVSRARAASSNYDVTKKGVDTLFKLSGASILIHGHTHKPAKHHETGGIRWVLPDWNLDHGERRGGYLRMDAKGFKAISFD